MCMCVHLHVPPTGKYQVFLDSSPSFFLFVYVRQSWLNLDLADSSRLVGQQVSEPLQYYRPVLCRGFFVCVSFFNLGAGDLSLGPHICIPSTLLTKLFLQHLVFSVLCAASHFILKTIFIIIDNNNYFCPNLQMNVIVLLVSNSKWRNKDEVKYVSFEVTWSYFNMKWWQVKHQCLWLESSSCWSLCVRVRVLCTMTFVPIHFSNSCLYLCRKSVRASHNYSIQSNSYK